MYPDGYSAAILVERKTVSVKNPCELAVKGFGEVHSGRLPRREENGLLPVPTLLGVAALIRWLRYYLLRTLFC